MVWPELAGKELKPQREDKAESQRSRSGWPRQEDMDFDDREKDLDVVPARIEHLIDEREERARTIRSALPEVQQSSRRQFDAVGSLITQAS